MCALPISDATIGAVVARDASGVDANEPLASAVRRMQELGRAALPVLQHGALIGLITRENVGDLLVVHDALQRRARA